MSAKTYDNPYADVMLSVEYKGPDGSVIRGFGFWDGGKTFKIRFMFPHPGRWTWRTTCSDPSDSGLHNRSGTVTVGLNRAGDNPLYRLGYLRVADSQRYLCHADGTPFLWIGDTAWAAPMNASFADWQTYVRDRRGKHFTVVQIFCASEWAGTRDVAGHAPFEGEGLARWNPAYWQEYEKKVQDANEQGLLVAVMGLMEPVKRYPEEAEARRFARNLAARLMGNHVVFSPSFDSKYMPLGDTVAETVREAAPFHLITQHPGTNLPTAQTYHGKAVLDFCGLQSGAGWGSTPLSPQTASRNAIEWTLQLYRLQPTKPVVNLEARYDNEMNQKQLPRLPRSCGYLTMLSGAAGYTYGCAGIWNWGQSFVGKDPQASPWEWRKGLEQRSSTEMKFMAEFFRRIPWWRLVPRPELIRNQSENWIERMVLAATDKGDLAVAYLPQNPSIRIAMQSFPTSMSIRWYNPKDGKEVVERKHAANVGEAAFQRPDTWEDALLVLQSDARRWEPRGNYGRRLEPAGDFVLHGAGQSHQELERWRREMKNPHFAHGGAEKRPPWTLPVGR